MAYHPLVVEVISNYPSVQFVLNQTSGKHVCLPQHPAGQDQTIWKLKAMARNPLVSTKGVTTAKEGVSYFAGTPILFCKRYNDTRRLCYKFVAMCTVASWVPSAIHFSANLLSQRCPLPYYQMVWTKHFPGSDLSYDFEKQVLCFW